MTWTIKSIGPKWLGLEIEKKQSKEWTAILKRLVQIQGYQTALVEESSAIEVQGREQRDVGISEAFGVMARSASTCSEKRAVKGALANLVSMSTQMVTQEHGKSRFGRQDPPSANYH